VKHANEARISAQYPAQKNQAETVRHTPTLSTAEPTPSDISPSSTARRGCKARFTLLRFRQIEQAGTESTRVVSRKPFNKPQHHEKLIFNIQHVYFPRIRSLSHDRACQLVVTAPGNSPSPVDESASRRELREDSSLQFPGRCAGVAAKPFPQLHVF
jgi:hypothetical protein